MQTGKLVVICEPVRSFTQQNYWRGSGQQLLSSASDNTYYVGKGFASKVLVAPKVGFLPQKSFRSVIPFADCDLPAAISEFVLCWPLGFNFGWFVGWSEE